jgi:hypothetical protein
VRHTAAARIRPSIGRMVVFFMVEGFEVQLNWAINYIKPFNETDYSFGLPLT